MVTHLKTLIVFRHGETPHNRMIAGKLKSKKKIDHRKVTLTSVGRRQGSIVSKVIDDLGYEIDVCFYSSYQRTYEMAKIVLPKLPNKLLLMHSGLDERDMGCFTDVPRPDFHEHYKEESQAKARDPLGWRPEIIRDDSAQKGQTLLEKAKQVVPLLQEVATKYAGGCVAFSSHHDTNVAMRSLPRLAGLGNKELKRITPPLTLGLPNPLWVQNAQLDIYQWEDNPLPSYFRSIATSGTKFDTGWRPLNVAH